MELVISLAILSAALVVIAGLIPAGVTSLRKAHDVQAATLYGMEVVEEACRGTAKPDVSDITRQVFINKTDFRVRRQIRGVDAASPPNLFDVAVTITWAGQPRPVKLRTRIYRP